MKRRVATSHPFFSPLASFGGSVRTIFFNDGWFFQRSTFCHPFFQGLYRTNNYFIQTSCLLWRPFLFSYLKSIIFVFFISRSNASVFATERRQSPIVWSILCRFHSLYQSFAATYCHLLLLVVIRCHSMDDSSVFSWTITMCCENLLLLNVIIFFLGTLHLFAQFIRKNFSEKRFIFNINLTGTFVFN